MGEMLRFTCPDSSTASAYLARAANSARGAAIVVLQEWWGLNEQIKGVADRCAAAGYDALAPDLYEGRVTGDPDEAGHLMEGLDWVGATEQEVRGAAQYLKGYADKVAVMGFCMGGALVVIAAAKLSEVDAGVCFYGIPPRENADPKAISAPFLGHFAVYDDWCTPQAVDELERALQAGRVDHEIHRYDAHHAFFNEESESAYDAAATELSWRRTLDFLSRKLA